VEIYIKPKKKAALLNRHEILVSDVADVVSHPEVMAAVNKIKLKDIHASDAISAGNKNKNYLISVMDIIKKINMQYPEIVINNVGETDTWVHCISRKKRESPWLLWVRITAVSVILLVGAATAIMSFHTDGQIPKVFERYYSIFYGTQRTNPPIITIPYSIGLAVGIIVFYNHFMGRKITDDPTPIEVEIEQYEKEVTEAMTALMEKREESP